MKIEILESSCLRCKKTKEIIEKIFKENGVEAEVIKVEDFETILNYGVMTTKLLSLMGA